MYSACELLLSPPGGVADDASRASVPTLVGGSPRNVMRARFALPSLVCAAALVVASVSALQAQEPPALPPADPDPLGSAAPPAALPPSTPYPSTASPYPSAAPAATTPPTAPAGSARDIPSSGDAFPAESTKDPGPNTLFDSSKDYAFGGFGGLNIMYARIAGTHGVMVGGEAAVIIDHALTFGGGGYGFVVPIEGSKYSGVQDDVLHFGYGGAIVRYHFRSLEAINVAVGTLIGAGGIAIGQESSSPDPETGNEFDISKSEAMFVLEPQVAVFANMTRWFRVGAMVGYRAVVGVETRNLSASDLSGISAGGGLHFGWF